MARSPPALRRRADEVRQHDLLFLVEYGENRLGLFLCDRVKDLLGDLLAHVLMTGTALGEHLRDARFAERSKNAAGKFGLLLGNAGYEVSVATVDASSREAVHALVETATRLGDVTGLIHAAGVSPTQASPAPILKVDL